MLQILQGPIHLFNEKRESRQITTKELYIEFVAKAVEITKQCILLIFLYRVSYISSMASDSM